MKDITWFQWLFCGMTVVLAVQSLITMFRGRSTHKEGIFWALLWGAATFAIYDPKITRVVANAVGIGRGADLVLYVAVMAMGVGFFLVYARLRRMRREMTLLVRHIAIRDAVGPGTGSERIPPAV